MNRRIATRVSNPRDDEAALAWQLERVGSVAWRGFSLKFQRLAFGYAVDSGWPDEEAALRWLEDHGLLNAGGLPPRGALVWYRIADTIRVGCSLGSAELIGPLPDAIGVTALSELDSDYLWSEPYFPFAH